MLKLAEIKAKSILNKSKIFDYCLNPYTGCQVGCRYCYAALFMRRYSGHKEAWGDFVDVKVNAPELLQKQLVKAKTGNVWISSVCDPYQPVEKEYGLTRKCLAVFARNNFPVTIQTKSVLVLRDLDILKDLKAVEVGFTLATDDEKIARFFEPGAAAVAKRLDALDKLHAAGIPTFAFIGPILPGDPQKLIENLNGLVDRVLVDKLNYAGFLKQYYQKAGFSREWTGPFFQEQKERLVSGLNRRKMAYEILF
ncbi:MAG: radical SAM protein [Thermodesulfobacteriota bacterium]